MYLRTPRQLHLELTNHCNAKCPMCSREIDPIKDIEALTLDHIQNSCNDLKFDQINYCGNDGDPLMAKDLVAIVNHFAPIQQLIHTNGSLRSKEFWINLARTPNVKVIFAIDGATAETHEKYRVNTSFETILKNAKIFNDAGGKSWWQFIVFEHNQHEIEQAKKLAKDYGFSKFELLYSRRNDTEEIKTIKFIQNKNEFECKSVKREEIYIRSDGEVFPCVYHGARGNQSGLNIKNRSLKDIVFDVYFDKFKFDNPTCQLNCNSDYKNHRKRLDL
jgi:MoaA/NifB/PqqE/SkfB family radical SAM enzyme